MIIHLGIDSTDSPLGGCTTFTMVKIIDELHIADPTFVLIGYPRLVRLNPNVPTKTRGNASLGLTFDTELNLDIIKKLVSDIVMEDFRQFDDHSGKKPGIALLTGDIEFNKLYEASLQTILTLDDIKANYPKIWVSPENSLGLIGASIAATTKFEADHTFELLAYRLSKHCGSPRAVDVEKIKKLGYAEDLFSSFDFENNRELIAPSGPDPIFCGIRGNNPYKLKQYFSDLAIEENLEGICLFISNQGTDDHVKRPQSSIIPNFVVSSLANVHKLPEDLPGGHVKIALRFGEHIIDTMAFQPTGNLRNVVRSLLPGDLIQVDANVKMNEFGLSIAIESFVIIDLINKIERRPQICPNGHTMTKAGLFKGYKCKECGFTTLQTNDVVVERALYPGQLVFADLKAQRHLTRPLSRHHIKNKQNLVKKLQYHEIRTRFY